MGEVHILIMHPRRFIGFKKALFKETRSTIITDQAVDNTVRKFIICCIAKKNIRSSAYKIAIFLPFYLDNLTRFINEIDSSAFLKPI